MLTPRRDGMKALGIAFASFGLMRDARAESPMPARTHALGKLTKRLASLPRRRDLKVSPMILDHRDQWDAQALDAAGGKITGNSFLAAPAAADRNLKSHEDPVGAFSPAANSIPALQRRGSVFFACHDAIWELGTKLIATEVNPDKLNAETICVELSNHLVPGAVGTLVELANAGFSFVAQQIRASLVKAGGESLAEAVYGAKVAAGTTVLTRIHHRQTPLFLMQGLGQAGVTWTSEAIFQERQGHPIAHIPIPPEQNTRAIYSAAMVTDAEHTDAARAWLDFIRSDAAFAALAPFGFQRLGQ